MVGVGSSCMAEMTSAIWVVGGSIIAATCVEGGAPREASRTPGRTQSFRFTPYV